MPTPVVPEKRKLPIGLLAFCKPALDLLTASETATNRRMSQWIPMLRTTTMILMMVKEVSQIQAKTVLRKMQYNMMSYKARGIQYFAGNLVESLNTSA